LDKSQGKGESSQAGTEGCPAIHYVHCLGVTLSATEYDATLALLIVLE
jgi:hypothetical protein